MSIVAPKSFWLIQSLYGIMHKDSFASIMSVPKEDINKRINLAKLVLENSKQENGVLGGYLGDRMNKTIEIYIEVMNMIMNSDTEYITKAIDNQDGLHSYIS